MVVSVAHRWIPLLLWLLGPAVFGQRLDPVHWSLEPVTPQAAPGGKAVLKLTATIDAPWHLYSPTTPKGGPIVTSIAPEESPAIRESQIWRPKPVRKFDPNFGIDTETYEGQAVFYLELTLADPAPEGALEVKVKTRYQACTDKECLPPVRKQAAALITVSRKAAAAIWNPPQGYQTVQSVLAAENAASANRAGPGQSDAVGRFALIAFGLGLAAVFTPCVFPMVPFTMSYFLNRQSRSRADSIFHAGLFSLGIVLLFTALGLLTTALLGPFGVIQLGSSPWVNGVIAVVFVAFGLSLLGAFEITLPAGLLTRLDHASRRGGVLGTLLMGLTFSLTSFACVGPFVGSLLAASVQGGGLRPAVGMLCFAGGLAFPFFFLALFPAALARMPKSGGWLPRVKIVLGFLILAAALKYASNVDQVMQWNLISRERFLAAWVVLFALPGLYLLGLVRMEGIDPERPLGPGRALFGAAFLVFALSLIPGMFGGRLGELDAYVPAASEPGGAFQAAGGEPLPWLKNQYEQALEQARRENKLVFVQFTGYACTNCHWMKANMFPRPEIRDQLRKFVLVELYTDGADAASEQNQQLQQSKFSTIAIPFYVLMDANERVIATFPGLTRNPQEFLAFLRTGSGGGS